VIVQILIDDAAITRLTWEELTNTVNEEFESSKTETVRALAAARRRFSLEVGDAKGEEDGPQNQQV
jgi:hypothetical protein